MQTIISSSPLSRAKGRKVLYVPGGPEGFDRLFLELFDHTFRVEEHSLYFKPSIITYPLPMLEFMDTSKEDIQRKNVIFDGFRQKRCIFTEILQKSALLDIISQDSLSHKFKFYGPTITQRHVEDHLQELMKMVKNFDPCYNLVLTDAPLPFLLSIFKIEETPTQFYTTFFRQLISEHDPDVNSFVINDEPIYQNILRDVVNWVINHPTTITSRDKVFHQLHATWERLHTQGPIAS